MSSTGYPEASQAVLVLVLGILGLILCQVLAPAAWVVGNNELQAIAVGRRPPDNRSLANAGRILGIVGTVLLVLGVLVIVVILAVGGIAAFNAGTPS